MVVQEMVVGAAENACTLGHETLLCSDIIVCKLEMSTARIG